MASETAEGSAACAIWSRSRRLWACALVSVKIGIGHVQSCSCSREGAYVRRTDLEQIQVRVGVALPHRVMPMRGVDLLGRFGFRRFVNGCLAPRMRLHGCMPCGAVMGDRCTLRRVTRHMMGAASGSMMRGVVTAVTGRMVTTRMVGVRATCVVARGVGDRMSSAHKLPPFHCGHARTTLATAPTYYGCAMPPPVTRLR